MPSLGVVFRTPAGGTRRLEYVVAAGRVAARFVSLLTRVGVPARMAHTIIVDNHAQRRAEELERLNALVTFLDREYGLLGGAAIPAGIDQNVLNELHSRFETFERSGHASATARIAAAFEDLNRQIHICEGYLAGLDRGDRAPRKVFFSAETIPVLTEPLVTADYDELEIQLKPGTLYMGYYTVGKNFLSVFQQNDLDIVRARRVAPQTCANTQIVGLLASPDLPIPSDEAIRDAFFAWWDENALDHCGYDRRSSSQLALGWFPIAQLKDSDGGAAADMVAGATEIVAMDLASME